MKRARWRAPLLPLCLFGLTVGAWGQEAAKVTVRQVDSLGNTLAEEAYVSTEEAFASVAAPARSGQRFMYWTAVPEQPNFTNRDAWGRALDAVTVVPKDKIVTLTAVYGDASADADGNGMSDAEEAYWYGRTVGADEDTDGDGYTFAEELRYGMNPLFPNTLALGGVAYGDGPALLYNPNGHATYVVRSEPEGKLFATYTGAAAPGATITTASYSEKSTVFAYWTVNGARQHDAWGVSLNAVAWVVADATPLEFVAHCVEDAPTRQAYYWYGAEASPDSDTDGDGYTFDEELRYGMNPVFPNTLALGGVAYGDGPTLLYNPNGYPEITLRSEPEGVFPTETFVLRPGDARTTTAYTPADRFRGWTRNAERQADAWGRALDALTLTGGTGIGKVEVVAAFDDDEHRRLSHYWYGVDDQPADSDTDGDGYTFAEELRYGMNPLFPNTLTLGGVAYGDGPLQEANLQIFDQGSKVLLGGTLADFFATLDDVTGELTGGRDFGGAVAPAILDLDGDGRFDFLAFAQGTLTRYRNIGAEGSPDFEAAVVEGSPLAAALADLTRPVLCGGNPATGPTVWFCDNGGDIQAYDLATGATVPTGLRGFPVWEAQAGLGAFAEGTLVLSTGVTLVCDVVPESVTSAALAEATGDGLADLLVADAKGRVSLYERVGDGFTLRHRVWGGSFEGFAEGLALAPVDWDADGDLDALCGTADGHLLLLSDPKVGRPSNLRAAAGYDNVRLAWDPNGQSRVCGYNVYRADVAATGFAALGESPLPAYRDTPPGIAEWAYRVTALSRRWVAGNSEPETFESLPSDVVRVDLGAVTLGMEARVEAYQGQLLAVRMGVSNTQGLAANLSLTFAYDPALLEPEGLVPSALAKRLTLTSDAADGTWTVASSGGALGVGTGELVSLRFRAKGTGEGAVRLTDAAFRSAKGLPVAVRPGLPLSTAVSLTAPPTPPEVTLRSKDVEASSAETVEVPLSVSVKAGTAALDWATLTVTPTYDAALLELVSAPTFTAAAPTGNYVFRVLRRTAEAQVAEIRFDGYARSVEGLAAEINAALGRVIVPAQESGPALVYLKVVGNVGGESDDDDEDEYELDVLVGETVTFYVKAIAKGPLDWDSLTLTPTWKPQPSLRQEGDIAWVNRKGQNERAHASEATPYARVTFVVQEPPRGHDDDDWDDDIDLRLTGTAKSMGGAEAKVRGCVCELEIEGRLDPTHVPPWTNGDCDGDGRLTGKDYQIAFRLSQEYHQTGNPKKDKPHSADGADAKAHASLLMVPSLDDPLRHADIPTVYKRYLLARGVPKKELNMGNGGKQ